MKQIPNFPGYFADENGSIWTIKRKGGNDRSAGKTGAPIKLACRRDDRGYFRVNLDRNGKTISRLVHQLVLETFVGPPATHKQCRKCKQTKPVADFYRDKRSSDGLKTECKPCHSATATASRNPEKKRASNREYMRRVRSA